MQETQVRSLGQEDPLEKDMATHSVFLSGKTHGLRSLVGYTPWAGKESYKTEQLTHTHKALVRTEHDAVSAVFSMVLAYSKQTQ